MQILNKLIRFYQHLFWSYQKQAQHEGVIMGNNNYIGSHFWDSEPYLITIGNDCAITENTKIYTHGGARVARNIYPNFDVFGKVVLGNRVYVGAGAMIMPGVTIGDNVLIASGSIVTKSIPSNVVVAGNPAKYICTLDEYIEKNRPYNTDTKALDSNSKKKFLLNLPDEKFVKKGFIQTP